MKLFSYVLLLLIAACSSTPAFKEPEHVEFGTEKFPPIILHVNSGQACFVERSCSYEDKFLEELRIANAFQNIDTMNPQSEYRLTIDFQPADDEETREKESLHKKTFGIWPVHLKRQFNGIFVIEGNYGMIKTYTYNVTGTEGEFLTSGDNRDELYATAIRTMTGYFLADMKRDKPLPVSNY